MTVGTSPTLELVTLMGRVKRPYVVALLLLCACGGERFTWAFAQDMDGSFRPNESCRESLAESIYVPENEAKLLREASTNVFVFTGAFQTYKIYGFQSQQECETTLSNMVLRRQLTRP